MLLTVPPPVCFDKPQKIHSETTTLQSNFSLSSLYPLELRMGGQLGKDPASSYQMRHG